MLVWMKDKRKDERFTKLIKDRVSKDTKFLTERKEQNDKKTQNGNSASGK